MICFRYGMSPRLSKSEVGFAFRRKNKMNATYNSVILAHGREVRWIQISTGIYVAGHISSFLFRSAFARKSKNTTGQSSKATLEVSQTNIVFTERKYRHEVRSKNEKSRSRVNRCVYHARRKEGIPPHPCWIASLINPNLNVIANVKINTEHHKMEPSSRGERKHTFSSALNPPFPDAHSGSPLHHPPQS